MIMVKSIVYFSNLIDFYSARSPGHPLMVATSEDIIGPSQNPQTLLSLSLIRLGQKP